MALTVTRDYILEEKYSIWVDDSMWVEALEIKHQVFFSSALVVVILSMKMTIEQHSTHLYTLKHCSKSERSTPFDEHNVM